MFAPSIFPKRDAKYRKLLMTGLLFSSASSWALPTGEQLVAGQATVSIPTANLMQIKQNSQRAILNWQDFSIAANQTVNIQQPNASAALLNRVVGQNASQIQGQLNANGQVYLVNPNGVLFGKTAQVDVGGLIASTHNISNADFMNGQQHFTQDGATGSVENFGQINSHQGGVVALIGQNVSNTGTINTPQGTTVLAAGKTVDLDFQGNGLVEVKITESALKAQITNQGAIQAEGGRVILTAKAAGQLLDTVINQQGIIRAQGLAQRNGEIILEAGNVLQTGTLDASGITGGKIHLEAANSASISGKLSATGTQGGIIDMVAPDRVVLANAIVDATGTQKGGLIRVGGDFHGANPILTNAKTTAIDNMTTLKADGNNGQVVVWSNQQTDYYGSISANKAGKIEVSSKGLLNYAGRANAGFGGSLLLDPKDIIIGNATQQFDIPLDPNYIVSFSNSTPTIVFGKKNATANFNGISDALSSGTNVTLQANNDITIDSGTGIIVKPANGIAGNFTLQAGRSINIGASIDTAGGTFTAIAGDPKAVPTDRDPGIATIKLDKGVTINAGAGKVIIATNGGNFINDSGSKTPITASQWLIYSTDPDLNTSNGMIANKHYAQPPYTGVTPSYASTGNWFLYSITPILTVTPNKKTIFAGITPRNFTAKSITGFIDGDTISNAGITGTGTYTIDNYTGAIGFYNISYLNGFASRLGYTFIDDTKSINELKVVRFNLFNILHEILDDHLDRIHDISDDDSPNDILDDHSNDISHSNSHNNTSIEVKIEHEKSTILNPQITPLQQSTITKFERSQDAVIHDDLIVMEIENNGIKQPVKPHKIINLSICHTSDISRLP